MYSPPVASIPQLLLPGLPWQEGHLEVTHPRVEALPGLLEASFQAQSSLGGPEIPVCFSPVGGRCCELHLPAPSAPSFPLRIR